MSGKGAKRAFEIQLSASDSSSDSDSDTHEEEKDKAEDRAVIADDDTSNDAPKLGASNRTSRSRLHKRVHAVSSDEMSSRSRSPSNSSLTSPSNSPLSSPSAKRKRT